MPEVKNQDLTPISPISRANSVFWSGNGNMARAAEYGTTLEKTAIGAILNRGGKNVPYSVWKAASNIFSRNASGTAIKVGTEEGNIWLTVEKPILQQNVVGIRYVPQEKLCPIKKHFPMAVHWNGLTVRH